MATEQDVELAILSMDAYNQGDLRGMDVPNQVSIGGASLRVNDSDSSVSFFASEYRLADGQIVIAYRGTMYNGALGPNGGDILDGWPGGIGIYSAPQETDAIQFFQAVAVSQDSALGPSGSDAGDWQSADIEVTGHSLGGGLAGYVGGLYGLSGDIFDNMAFESSASGAYQEACNPNDPDSDYWDQFIYGGASEYPYRPVFSGLSAFATTGEILSTDRTLQTTPIENLSSNAGSDATSVNLHSMALLTLLVDADAKGYTTWQSIGPALYNAESGGDALAQAVGVTKTGWFTAHDAMLTAIAYSAAQGSSPFGTEAASSYFHDADLLGLLVSSTNLSDVLATPSVQQYLADILVQHAGDQAWNAGQNNGVDSEDGNGVFSVQDEALTVNLNPSDWISTTANGGQIVGASGLIDNVVATALMNTQLNGGVAAPALISTAAFNTMDDPSEIVIADSPDTQIDTSDASSAVVFAGANGGVCGGSSNDLIVGGTCVDTGDGNDVVIAQSGDETITLGGGSNYVLGYQDPNTLHDDTVVLSGDRSEYEITHDARDSNVIDLSCPSGDSSLPTVDYVANVGCFSFADEQGLSLNDLFAIKNVRFALSGVEAATAAPTLAASVIGNVVSDVGNPNDTFTYTLDPLDPSSHDFTLTPDGVLSLNAGVEVDDSAWLSDLSALREAGWNWVIGATGEMSQNSPLPGENQVSPQQLLAGTPFEATVEVTDQTTGATTEQTLVIPVTDQAPSALAWAPGTTGTISDNAATDTQVGTVKVIDDDPSGWTFTPAAGSDPDFKIDPNTGVVSVAQGGIANLDKGADWSTEISVVVTDVAGNQAPLSLPISVHHVDNAPTAFSVTNPLVDQLVTDGQVVATLKTVLDPDPGDTARLKLISVSDPSLAGRFAVDPTGQNIVVVGSDPLPVETINLGLAVVDSGGLQSPTQTTPIVVAAAVLPLSLSLSDDTSGGLGITSDDTLKGIGQVGATVTFSDNGVGLGSTTVASNGTYNFKPTGLTDGVQNIVASETDGVMSKSQSLAFTQDTTPPILTINGNGGYLPLNSGYPPAVTISGTLSDAHPATTVAVYDINQDYSGIRYFLGSAIVQQNGSWSINATLPVDNNEIYAFSGDMADNTVQTGLVNIQCGSLGWLNGSTPTINEFPTNGSVVGAVAAYFDQTAWNYSLTNSFGGAFAINSSTGVVTVANGSMLNYDTTPSLNIGVELTDPQGRKFDQNLTVDLSTHHAPPTAFYYQASSALPSYITAGTTILRLTGVVDVDQTDGFHLWLVGDSSGDFRLSNDGESIVAARSCTLPSQFSLRLNVVDGDGYSMSAPATIIFNVTRSQQSQSAMTASTVSPADGATSSADVAASSEAITAASVLAADSSVSVTQASALATPIGGDAPFDGGDWGNATTARIHSSAATGDVFDFGSNSVRDEILRSQSAGGLDLAGGATGRSDSDIAQVGANVLNHPRFGDSLVDSASAGAGNHWKLAA
jgi:hypothetical protein